jgi:hypothetical protein
MSKILASSSQVRMLFEFACSQVGQGNAGVVWRSKTVLLSAPHMTRRRLANEMWAVRSREVTQACAH